MNTTGVLMLLSLSLFCLFSDVAAQTQINCSEFMEDSTCTRVGEPVCGTDNMTYGNKCAFCKAARTKKNLAVKHMGNC